MNVPLNGDEYRKVFGNLATLSPSAQDAPDMTIKVSTGGFWTFITTPAYVEYAGGSSPAITAPASNAKWVVVCLTEAGLLANIDGTSGTAPTLPTIPKNRYPIALVYVRSTDTVITNEYVFDARPIFSLPIRSHAYLEGTSEVECHPISAITDLTTTLAGKVASTDLTNGLATKADTTGTPSASFILNADLTGTPSSDGEFEVERGSSTNVKIKWDENVDKWCYTNDGSAWHYFTDYYLNDGTELLYLKVYSQTSAPSLTDGTAAIWIDTDDSNKVYLAFKPTGLTQVKIELT